MSRPVAPGDDLYRWLTPFLAVMGRSTRRQWGPLYVRGLLGPDGPKSVQPIASRLGLRGHDQLHHFVSSPAWDDAPLWRVLAERADAQVGGEDAVLVIDDTAIPKKGTLSVGVAAQYCGELGKQANCQSLVSLTLACGEVPIPLGLRLFLPKSWTDDAARCARAGVPEAVRVPLTRPEITLAASIASSPLAFASAPSWPMRATGSRAIPPELERPRSRLVGRKRLPTAAATFFDVLCQAARR